MTLFVRSLGRVEGSPQVPPASPPPSFPKLLPLLRRVIGLALQVVPVGSLKPTEEIDPVRVQLLRDKVESNGYLDKPLDTLGSHVLDGHTRLGVAEVLGLRHVPTLNHTHTDLTCATWVVANRHAVAEKERWRGAIEMSFEEFLESPKVPFSACILALEDGICRVFPQNKELRETLALQNQLYKVFARTSNGLAIDRLRDDELPPTLELCRSQLGDRSEVLLYPAFSPEQILEVAHAELMVAPGATRFGFPYRLTNLRVPLSLLRSGESTERKNQRLQAVLGAHPLSSFDGETFIPQPGIDAEAYEEA